MPNHEYTDTPRIPEGMTIKQWNAMRREQVSSLRSARFHRSSFNITNNISKVDPKEVSHHG